MLLPPQSEKKTNGTATTPNGAVVREQLRRLLATPIPLLLPYSRVEVLPDLPRRFTGAA